VAKYNAEQMQNMVNRLGSDQKIADAVGLTRQSIQQQRKELGIKSYKQTVLIQRNERIKGFREKGWSVNDLSLKFKLSTRQIKRIIRGVEINENN